MAHFVLCFVGVVWASFCVCSLVFIMEMVLSRI